MTSSAAQRANVAQCTNPAQCANAAQHGGNGRNLQMLDDDVSKELVQLFKLLSDDTRLRILFLLKQQKELNVRTLCGLLQQSQPAVSHHLALLRVGGLIECRRDGKHNFYHVMPERFEQLMELIVAASPGEDGEIRFADHVLSYKPTDGE